MSIAVLYATREGQTRRIAERVADRLRGAGHAVDLIDVAHAARSLSLDAYAAVVVAASVHLGRHEREMVRFVLRHRAALEKLPSAFLSVSLAAVNAEDVRVPEELREEAAQQVRDVLDRFTATTGWRPRQERAVAGALLYSKYGPLTRFVMKRLAARAGLAGDGATDREYTDWSALDRFADAFAAGLGAPPPPRPELRPLV